MKENQELISKFTLENPELNEKLPKGLVEKIRNAQRAQILCKTFPYRTKMPRKIYELEKRKLQIELVKLQNWIKKTDERMVIVFEGRDAAGKGGTIKRFMEHLNPRGARVVALVKPTERESGQWYFQRYVRNLPTSGEITFFDRSWYNRAGVERVMNFCTPQEYRVLMNQVSEFEKMIVESGVRFIKFWFSVSREEQLRRFIQRARDPLKQWKLSEMDFESLSRWKQYTVAKDTMFYHTDTALCPWRVVRSDDKKRARLNAMRYVLNSVNYAGKIQQNIGRVDPLILGSADNIYEVGEKHQRLRFQKKVQSQTNTSKPSIILKPSATK